MKKIIAQAFILIGLLQSFSGCATTDHCSTKNYTSSVVDRLKSAATESFIDPYTWVPLAGAALCSVDDFDGKISNWAVKHHPVFSSGKNAGNASDDLLEFLEMSAWMTAALAPRSERATKKEILLDTLQSSGIIALTGKIGDYQLSTKKKNWLIAANIGAAYFYTVPESKSSKTRLMAGQWLSHEGNTQLTFQLKNETNRIRPNKSDDRSFPSGHTSIAFNSARLISQNLDHYDFDDTVNFWLKTGVFTLASATGWARVEAQKHYPSDVLFGGALGNYLAAFVNHLLMDDDQENFSIRINTVNEELAINYSFRF